MPKKITKNNATTSHSNADLLNSLHAIDTASVLLPTFEVKHEGGLKEATKNIIDAIEKAANELTKFKEDEIEKDQWRRLALQFDGHRMQAIGHLKAMLKDPIAHAKSASEFLSQGPISGERILADRIEAIVKKQG